MITTVRLDFFHTLAVYNLVQGEQVTEFIERRLSRPTMLNVYLRLVLAHIIYLYAKDLHTVKLKIN